MSENRLQVTLAHDWLTGMRGGERVLERLCRLWPDAPILTLMHKPGRLSADIESHAIRTSPLQRVPGIFSFYRYFLPVMPWAVGRLRAPPSDLLISTSHCVAKGVRPPAGAKHLCICFTPMRYAWSLQDDYFGRRSIKRMAFDPFLRAMRAWDRRASSRVDRFVAISRHVKDRIRRFYDRDADIVYPPVALDYYTPADAPPEPFDLVVSALVPYKRIDRAVEAYTRMGRALTVIGEGTEYARLCRMAGPTITFKGRLPDDAVRDHYRRCRCLVFPGEEDFGLVPIEAQACGRPVIALGRGGALETIELDVSGILYKGDGVEALVDAVKRFDERTWDPAAIRAQAERFSPEAFVRGLEQAIEALWS